MLRRRVCRHRDWSRPHSSTARLSAAALFTSWALIAGSALGGCGSTINADAVKSDFAPQEPMVETGALSPTGGAGAAPVRLADASAFTDVATPGSHAYKIGPLDVLEVSVFKVPDLSRSVQVADTGTVNLPLVGEIAAVGKTAREVEIDLTKKLGAKYLQSPQVTVYVKEYNSRRVTVEGAVKKPGVYPIRGKTTLLQFVAQAEGMTDVADTDSVVVFRGASGQRSIGRFDIDEIRAGRSADPIIQEGDVIVVNESSSKVALQNILKVLPVGNVFVPLL